MVDPVVALIHKISEKQRRNISRNNMYERLNMSRRERERVLARKRNHVLFFRSLEETSADVETIAMLLVIPELNVPPVSTTSEPSISHIENGSISIADWIA